MLNFSYTKSGVLAERIQQIDSLRTDLLLTPLSPSTELKFQWEAELSCIQNLLALRGIAVDEALIRESLSPIGKRTTSPHQDRITKYKHAFDYLYHTWLVSSEPITSREFEAFYQEIFTGSLQIKRDKLDMSLKYIQVNPEHPVIQAALAQLLVFAMQPFSADNEEFAHFTLLMFLYKYGYDFRRMTVLPGAFLTDLVNYKNVLAGTERQSNVTAWLEYVAQLTANELMTVKARITNPAERVSFNKDLFTLNDRQKSVLALFDQPGIKVGNKLVQRLFRVSQITASRDLAHLTEMKLIFPIGKGRSTFYTKV